MGKRRQLLIGFTVLSLVILMIPAGRAQSNWFSNRITVTSEKSQNQKPVLQDTGNSFNYSDDFVNITFNFYNYIYSPDFQATYAPASVNNGTVQINATNMQNSEFYYDMNIDPKFDNMTFINFDFSANDLIRSTTWIFELHSLYIEDAPLGLNHATWKIYTNTSLTITIPIDIEVSITDTNGPSLTVETQHNGTVLGENDKITVDSGKTTAIINYDAEIIDKQSILGNFWILVNNEQQYKHQLSGLHSSTSGSLELDLGYYSIYFYVSDIFNNTSYRFYQINILQSALPQINLDYPFSITTYFVIFATGVKIRKNYYRGKIQ